MVAARQRGWLRMFLADLDRDHEHAMG
jgi:hypothetical protein